MYCTCTVHDIFQPEVQPELFSWALSVRPLDIICSYAFLCRMYGLFKCKLLFTSAFSVTQAPSPPPTCFPILVPALRVRSIFCVVQFDMWWVTSSIFISDPWCVVPSAFIQFSSWNPPPYIRITLPLYVMCLFLFRVVVSPQISVSSSRLKSPRWAHSQPWASPTV